MANLKEIEKKMAEFKKMREAERDLENKRDRMLELKEMAVNVASKEEADKVFDESYKICIDTKNKYQHDLKHSLTKLSIRTNEDGEHFNIKNYDTIINTHLQIRDTLKSKRKSK